jgi:hypothetical protein
MDPHRTDRRRDGAAKVFLLPCTRCGSDLEIVAGQAGGAANCPACGASCDVPKLRELGALRLKPVVSSRSGRGGGWGLPQAVALAGLACAIASFGAVALLGSPPTSAVSFEETRARIQAGDDKALYESLEQLSQATVERMPLPEEVGLQRQARFIEGISRVFYALGGLGTLAAAAAGIALIAGRKSS